MSCNGGDPLRVQVQATTKVLFRRLAAVMDQTMILEMEFAAQVPPSEHVYK